MALPQIKFMPYGSCIIRTAALYVRASLRCPGAQYADVQAARAALYGGRPGGDLREPAEPESHRAWPGLHSRQCAHLQHCHRGGRENTIFPG